MIRKLKFISEKGKFIQEGNGYLDEIDKRLLL